MHDGQCCLHTTATTRPCPRRFANRHRRSILSMPQRGTSVPGPAHRRHRARTWLRRAAIPSLAHRRVLAWGLSNWAERLRGQHANHLPQVQLALPAALTRPCAPVCARVLHAQHERIWLWRSVHRQRHCDAQPVYRGITDSHCAGWVSEQPLAPPTTLQPPAVGVFGCDVRQVHAEGGDRGLIGGRLRSDW